MTVNAVVVELQLIWFITDENYDVRYWWQLDFSSTTYIINMVKLFVMGSQLAEAPRLLMLFECSSFELGILSYILSRKSVYNTSSYWVQYFGYQVNNYCVIITVLATVY